MAPICSFVDLINFTRYLVTSKMTQFFWIGSQNFVTDFNPSRLFCHPAHHIFKKTSLPLPSFIQIVSLVYMAPNSTTLVWLFITKLNLSLTKYLDLHWFYLYRNLSLTVKTIGSEMPYAVRKSEIVNKKTSKLFFKILKTGTNQRTVFIKLNRLAKHDAVVTI